MIETETRPVILLTDFGQKDAFAGILKGVIASISPGSKVIDLTHEIEPQNILQAAFLLAASYPYFPPKSIFCAIVDPGVGSNRKAICIETRDYFFVGPDNGILWKAASQNKIKQIVHLTNHRYFLEQVSNTFQGRDIFAPVAAHLSKGLEGMSVLGDPVETCVEYHFPEIKRKGSTLMLCILHIDRFGNLTLNIMEKEFRQLVQEKSFCLTINDLRIKKVYETYSQAKDGEVFLIGSSSSYMEVSVKNSSAADRMNAKPMDKALLDLLPPD